jgi:hypothetical protein
MPYTDSFVTYWSSARVYTCAVRAICKILTIAIACVALPFSLVAQTKATSQARVCTKKDAEQALNLPDRYKDWHAAYRVFKQFGQCDDGAIAEGFSEAIAQLLVHDWPHLNVLVRLTSSDRAFKRFVLRHIDETLGDDELEAIASNARLGCPIGDQAFCRLIEKRASPDSDDPGKKAE